MHLRGREASSRSVSSSSVQICAEGSVAKLVADPHVLSPNSFDTWLWKVVLLGQSVPSFVSSRVLLCSLAPAFHFCKEKLFP